MELIIGLIVIGVVGYFVFFRNSEKTVVEAAPYKVETPAEAPTPVAEQATQAVVESIAPAKKPRAKKPATAKKPAAKKVVAKKSTAKKPKAK